MLLDDPDSLAAHGMTWALLKGDSAAPQKASEMVRNCSCGEHYSYLPSCAARASADSDAGADLVTAAWVKARPQQRQPLPEAQGAAQQQVQRFS